MKPTYQQQMLASWNKSPKTLESLGSILAKIVAKCLQRLSDPGFPTIRFAINEAWIAFVTEIGFPDYAGQFYTVLAARVVSQEGNDLGKYVEINTKSLRVEWMSEGSTDQAALALAHKLVGITVKFISPYSLHENLEVIEEVKKAWNMFCVLEQHPEYISYFDDCLMSVHGSIYGKWN